MYSVNDKTEEQMRDELLDFHVGNIYSVAIDSTQIREAGFVELLKLYTNMMLIKEQLKSVKEYAMKLRMGK